MPRPTVTPERLEELKKAVIKARVPYMETPSDYEQMMAYTEAL